MMLKTTALAAAAVMLLTAVGCGSKGGGSSSEPTTKGYITAKTYDIDDNYGSVPDPADGPLLTISNTTAKPGGIAQVTISVSNAERKWTMCGLHVSFPNVLDCVLADEASRSLQFDPGDALTAATGMVGKEWQEALPKDLVDNKRGALFFTAMFSGNNGLDGDIATFYFVVPKDAVPGTVYDLNYFYFSSDAVSDTFSNAEQDRSFEKYAFTHWQGGTITVE